MALDFRFRNGTVAYTNVTSSDPAGTVTDALAPIAVGLQLGPGTGAGQADRAYRDCRTLTDANITYTLSALPGGQAMVKVRFLVVSVDPSSTGTLAVAPGATHGWPALTLGLPLAAGSFVVLGWPAAAGAAVATGATDQVTFTATGAVTYTVVFAGTSA